jgi:hypothetical protein
VARAFRGDGVEGMLEFDPIALVRRDAVPSTMTRRRSNPPRGCLPMT